MRTAAISAIAVGAAAARSNVILRFISVPFREADRRLVLEGRVVG